MLEFEPDLARAYDRIVAPGDAVFDVGAYKGYHLAQLLGLVGPAGCMVAFEPIPHLAQALTLRYAGNRRVGIEQTALGATRGTSTFHYVKNGPPYSGLQRRVYKIPDPIVEMINVEVDTLDSYAGFFPRVSFVKIDIEGGRDRLPTWRAPLHRAASACVLGRIWQLLLHRLRPHRHHALRPRPIYRLCHRHCRWPPTRHAATMARRVRP